MVLCFAGIGHKAKQSKKLAYQSRAEKWLESWVWWVGMWFYIRLSALLDSLVLNTNRASLICSTYCNEAFCLFELQQPRSDVLHLYSLIFMVVFFLVCFYRMHFGQNTKVGCFKFLSNSSWRNGSLPSYDSSLSRKKCLCFVSKWWTGSNHDAYLDSLI